MSAPIPEDLQEEYDNAVIGAQNYGNSVTGAEYRMRKRHIERIAALSAFHEAAQLGAEYFLAQTMYADSAPHSSGAIARLMEDYAQLQVAALEAQVQQLREALETIRVYGSDTLSGRVDGPDDRIWQREAVLEMTCRARAALAATEPKP